MDPIKPNAFVHEGAVYLSVEPQVYAKLQRIAEAHRTNVAGLLVRCSEVEPAAPQVVNVGAGVEHVAVQIPKQQYDRLMKLQDGWPNPSLIGAIDYLLYFTDPECRWIFLRGKLGQEVHTRLHAYAAQGKWGPTEAIKDLLDRVADRAGQDKAVAESDVKWIQVSGRMHAALKVLSMDPAHAIGTLLEEQEKLREVLQSVGTATYPGTPIQCAIANIRSNESWIKVATDSNKAVDAYLRSVYPDLPEKYGMPVDGVRTVVEACRKTAEHLEKAVGKLRETIQQARGYLIRNVLLTSSVDIRPQPDLLGVCTQVDNIVAGLRASDPLPPIDTLQLAQMFYECWMGAGETSPHAVSTWDEVPEDGRLRFRQTAKAVLERLQDRTARRAGRPGQVELEPYRQTDFKLNAEDDEEQRQEQAAQPTDTWTCVTHALAGVESRLESLQGAMRNEGHGDLYSSRMRYIWIWLAKLGSSLEAYRKPKQEQQAAQQPEDLEWEQVRGTLSSTIGKLEDTTNRTDLEQAVYYRLQRLQRQLAKYHQHRTPQPVQVQQQSPTPEIEKKQAEQRYQHFIQYTTKDLIEAALRSGTMLEQVQLVDGCKRIAQKLWEISPR